MRTWYENEELLRHFREWLGRTEAEIAALGYDGSYVDAAAENPPDVGMIQLIEAFTALRQEVKLQTKSNRGLEDALHEAITGLDQAAEQMRSVDAREADAVARAARPLVEALIELDEALERGLRAARTAHANVLEDTGRRFDQDAEQRYRQLPFWQRWKARTWFDTSAELFRQHVADLHRRIMLPLLEGYELIYQRLERTLVQLDIERIECLGQPVDPTLMTVVELVDDPTAEPETVVQVVRPGYVWAGRLIRYAEVRAARQDPRTLNQLEEEPDEEEYEQQDEYDEEYEEDFEDRSEDAMAEQSAGPHELRLSDQEIPGQLQWFPEAEGTRDAEPTSDEEPVRWQTITTEEEQPAEDDEARQSETIQNAESTSDHETEQPQGDPQADATDDDQPPTIRTTTRRQPCRNRHLG
jgi:molecular chaperone GrpE